MSHKSAKRVRQLKRNLARDHRGYPWVEDGDCIAGTSMCHDCAFRKESKEMVRYMSGVDAPGAECGDPTIETVGLRISRLVKGDKQAGAFYCHFDKYGLEVPKDEHGNYIFTFGSDGKPSGHKACAGYLAMVERIRRVNEEDGDIPKRKRRPRLTRGEA